MRSYRKKCEICRYGDLGNDAYFAEREGRTVVKKMSFLDNRLWS